MTRATLEMQNPGIGRDFVYSLKNDAKN